MRHLVAVWAQRDVFGDNLSDTKFIDMAFKIASSRARCMNGTAVDEGPRNTFHLIKFTWVRYLKLLKCGFR